MASYTSTNLKLRVAPTATNKLSLYTQNEFSIISVLLFVVGICLWSAIKVPILECDRTRSELFSLRCQAKTVVFFGTTEAERTRFAEPSDTVVEINPVENVAIVSATPANYSPFAQFGPDAINHLQISDSNQTATIDIPIKANWREADGLVAHLQAAIASPDSPDVLVTSSLAAIAVRLAHAIENTEPAPIVISYPTPWRPYLPGLLAILASLLYARIPGSWFKFDRAQGMLTLKRHSLSPTLEYPIQEVQAIAVEEERFTSIEEPGEPQGSHSGYRISLVLASGKIEPLARTYSSNPKSKFESAEVIRAFLQLPPVIFKRSDP